MPAWALEATIALLLYGMVGLFQKVATTYLSAGSTIIYSTLGFLLALPWLAMTTPLYTDVPHVLLIAVGVGVFSQLGSWFLYEAFRRGGKAAVVVPLTGTYPLVTILLARTFLGERLSARQSLGIALALAASALISFGSEGDSSPERPTVPVHEPDKSAD